jgi:2-isopropylmalate synthase
MEDLTVVRVFDTTLRDGEQAPGFSMTPHEKVRLARQLDVLGVDIIEAGFPIASDGDFAAVHSIAAEIQRPVIAALARTAIADVERAAQALAGTGAARSMETRLPSSSLWACPNGPASGSGSSARA